MKRLLIGLLALTGAMTCSAAETASSAHDDTINIYFARHGKTLFNTFDRVQGWADTPLTPAASGKPWPSLLSRWA